jgi:hypothetical protein
VPSAKGSSAVGPGAEGSSPASGESSGLDGGVRGAGEATTGIGRSTQTTTATAPSSLAEERSGSAFEESMPDRGVAGSGENAPQWEAFLQFVRDEAGFDLYVTLTNCEVVRLETERIELRAMLDSFRRRLESSDTLGKLRALASRHFEREMTVGVAGATGASGGFSAHSIEADRTTELQERALADPLVRGALDVLGGKVGKISRIDE